MDWKLRPCNGCRMPGACPGVECPRWQEWFLGAWDGFNRKAALEAEKRNRLPEGKFLYGQPHEALDPCMGCPVKRWCHVPCQKRLWWWDHRMERIRRRFSE